MAGLVSLFLASVLVDGALLKSHIFLEKVRRIKGIFFKDLQLYSCFVSLTLARNNGSLVLVYVLYTFNHVKLSYC